jgi:hypothetical protein
LLATAAESSAAASSPIENTCGRIRGRRPLPLRRAGAPIG